MNTFKAKPENEKNVPIGIGNDETDRDELKAVLDEQESPEKSNYLDKLIGDINKFTFVDSVDGLLDPEREKGILKNPSFEDLREMAYQRGAIRTDTGAFMVTSEIKKRMPRKSVIQGDITNGDYLKFKAILEKEIPFKKLIQIDGVICEKVKVRVITTDQRQGPQIAYGAKKILFEGAKEQENLPNSEIDLVVFYTPGLREKPLVMIDNEKGRTIIIGSGYHGQDWKSILEMLSYRKKMENREKKSPEEKEIVKHIATRTFVVFDKNTGKFYKLPLEISGLSGTGKTTLGVSSNGLIDKFDKEELPEVPSLDEIEEAPPGYFSNPPESSDSRILVSAFTHADDAAILCGDGTMDGIVNAAYVKTEGLTDQELYAQPEIYRAMLQPNSGVMLENVAVNEETHQADFYNYTEHDTQNGRGLVGLNQLENFGGINAGRRRISIQLTRRNTLPAIFRFISPAQAEAAWTEGATVKTSAVLSAAELKKGPVPTQVFQYHPFQDGDRSEDALTHFEIGKAIDEQLKNEGKDPVQNIMANTGQIGNGINKWDIPPEVTTRTIAAIAKGVVKWKLYPELGVEVPEHIPGVDPKYFNPAAWYREQDRLQDLYSDWQAMFISRKEALSKFPKIPQEIRIAPGYGTPTKAMQPLSENNGNE
ncbi:MAG: phosphoenolpyruvate carboxykinase (ATP) [Patescibacteria group bacterium]